MARWNHKTVASALTLSCLALGAVSARGDDEKKQDKPKSEMVKVPLDALEEILKRHPNGSLMKISEFRELLRKAGLTRISDLDAAKAETPPVPYAVSRCDVTGDVSGDQATFEAVATIQVLDSKTVPLYLPLVAVGARDVSVDSRPASLARTGNGYGVLLEGPGERRVVWHFAVPVRKLEERGAGELSVPLFSQAVAGKLTLAIPGDLEITQQGSELPLTVDRDSEKTTLSAAIGGVEAMGLRFAPRVSEAQATP